MQQHQRGWSTGTGLNQESNLGRQLRIVTDTLILVLPYVLECLFYSILFVLPLDVYLTPPGSTTGVFLSQALTVEASVFLLMGILLARWKRISLPIRVSWKDALPFIAIVTACIFSVVFSDFRSAAAKNILKVLAYFGIYMLARALGKTPGVRMRALLVLLASFAVVVLAGITETLPGFPDLAGALLNIQRTIALLPGSAQNRVSATFRYPNELAAYLILILMLLIANALIARERKLQLCFAILALAGLWLLVLTYTRGALVAALIVTPALPWVLGRRRLAIVVMAGMLAVGGLLILHGGATSNRILSIFTTSTIGYSTRGNAWHWALSIFLHHPIFGVGSGTIQYQPGAPYSVPLLHIKETDAENLYLNVLAETGIVGFTAVMAAVVGALRQAWHYFQKGGDTFDRAWNLGILAGLAGILIYGMVDPILVSGQVTGFICALVGLLGLSSTAEQRSPSSHFSTSTPLISFLSKILGGIGESWQRSHTAR